jgi:hypothetical protein
MATGAFGSPAFGGTSSGNNNQTNVLKTLYSGQDVITVGANSTTQNLLIFPPNTLVSATFYIENPQDIPTGSTMEFVISMSSWINGSTTKINLDSYNYGKYFEDFPMSNINLINNFPVAINLYYQYSVKQYGDYFNSVVQDLTQLLFIPNVTTAALTGGTNFRYYGTIANLNLSGSPSLPTGTQFYVLDQQIIGTSSSVTGSVSVPWTTSYTENINVAASGASEDSNTYSFTVDADTLGIPGNVTSTNAIMNWVKMDFYSPLSVTLTNGSVNIVYNATTNEFEMDDAVSVSYYSSYLNFVGAPLTLITNTLT